MTVWTFIPPFFLPVLGWRPTPLNKRLENNVMVVESIICSLSIHYGHLRRRLSDISSCRWRAYKSLYIASKTASGRCLLASASVLRQVLKLISICIGKQRGGYLTQGVKSFDDGIQHNHQMNPPIKSFCVAFTSVFSAYFKNFWLVE